MKTEDHQPLAGESVLLSYDGESLGTYRSRDNTVVGLEFVYSPEWLKSARAFPISLTLPLQTNPHPPAVVYPWFMNLLPEGEALQVIGTILKVNELDVLAMVKEMGGDLPGALSVELPDKQNKPHYHQLTDEELADAIRRLPERPLLVGEDGVHMSLAGAQHKLAVVKYKDDTIGLALDGAPSTHILKPENKSFHASVENEAFCLRLAAAINLPAARATIHVVEDIKYLLVERYDRARTQGQIHRIHQEDMCQATGHLPYQKYEWNAAIHQHGPGVKTCLDALGGTLAPAANKLAFLDYLIFNILCGNVDAHAKNYSILLHPGGSQKLVPIYDVMNGDIYENVTKNLAMKIAGKQRADYLYGRHWDTLAQENDLSPRGVRARVKRISEAVLKALPAVAAELNELSPSLMYEQISLHVSRHCRNMLANLKAEPTAGDDKDDDNDQEDAVEVRTDDAPEETGMLISP